MGVKQVRGRLAFLGTVGLIAALAIALTTNPVSGYTAHGYTIPDGWGQEWPSGAPAATCTDGGGGTWPSTGVGAAAWFHYNGGGCGAWKEYDVLSGIDLKIIGYSDDCTGCVLYHINYDLYDWIGGAWSLVQSVDGPDVPGGTHLLDYQPVGDKIRIEASTGFYAEVHQAPNVPPVADLSWTPTTPTDLEDALFSDASTDSDGSVVSWSWDFGDGATSTAQDPAHGYADDGSYNVCLTVTDNHGATDTACDTITVLNVAPTAAFTWNPTTPTDIEDAFFSDASTDDDGSVVSWSWDFGDGATSTAQDPVHAYADNGDYTVCLTATDNDGATHQTCQTITVLNVAPVSVLSWSPTNPAVLEEVQFTDASYDVDGTIVHYNWTFGDGAQSFDQNPTYSFLETRDYDICLVTTDNDGAQTQHCEILEVLNAPPVADFIWSPDEPTDLQTPQFTDTSTDSDGNVDEWSWDFGDGATSTAQNPTHQFADNGDYTVCLTVEDDRNATDTLCQVVTVLNVGPTANFVLGSNPIDTNVQQTFTDTSTDADGTLASWAWDFGDGTTSTTQDPTHVYTDNGQYTVCLTVTDNDGATAQRCKSAQVTNVAPAAAFSANPNPVAANADIAFTDLSTDSDGTITGWSWDFGDGIVANMEAPVYQYATNGDYTVCLTATDDDGATDTACDTVTVLNAAPVADFSWLPAPPTDLDTVDFTDLSNDPDGSITAWAWDFGDGATSSAQAPSHAFADDGDYNVCLTVTDNNDATGTTCKLVAVLNVAPAPDFSWGPVTPTDLEDVVFSDASTDDDGSVVSWSWDFGDGGASSAQDPVHVFADDGDFQVCLTATDNDGDAATHCQTVSVLNVAPTAGFLPDANPAETNAATTFADASTDDDGTVMAWSWDFGDGATSTAQSPVHTFGDDGDYTVCLTVTDDDGAEDTLCELLTVLNAPPVADFLASLNPVDTNVQVDFTDLSSDSDGSITDWAWDFGDGATSSLREPSHTFTDDGDHEVCLTVTDNDGVTGVGCQTLSVLNVAPVADFAGAGGTIGTNTDVPLTDLSTDSDGTIASWAWDFGDGATSSDQDPVHQFADDGLYDVCLTVTDDDGATATACQTIEALNVAPDAGFSYLPVVPTTFEPVTFADASSDSDGSVVSWAWDFGDGATSTAQDPAHQFPTGGLYDVCLTVTDDDGAASTFCEAVQVSPLVMYGRGAGVYFELEFLTAMGLPGIIGYGDTTLLTTEQSDSASAQSFAVTENPFVTGASFTGATDMSLGTVESRGAAQDVTVFLPSGDVLSFAGLETVATATCQAGSTSVASGVILLNGDVVHAAQDPVPANLLLAGLPAGVTVMLNEQVAGPGLAEANGAHVRVDGLFDFVLAHAHGSIDNCPGSFGGDDFAAGGLGDRIASREA
ncbi:MAG: PKD domain-containing protein [Thermoplasmatota archaeon]